MINERLTIFAYASSLIFNRFLIAALISGKNLPEVIYLVRTQIFRKTNISYPLICTHMCSYQGVRNVCFSKNFAYILNEWYLIQNSKSFYLLIRLSTIFRSLCHSKVLNTPLEMAQVCQMCVKGSSIRVYHLFGTLKRNQFCSLLRSHLTIGLKN